MPKSSMSLNVHGTTRRGVHGLSLVLSARLDGHDTFLSGHLDLRDASIPVRILTLDDVTVLRPAAEANGLAFGETWSGVLHLPHGLRERRIPSDLQLAAEVHHRSLDALDEAESRYALTFLAEATTTTIRRARIHAIVSALPIRRSAS